MVFVPLDSAPAHDLGMNLLASSIAYRFAVWIVRTGDMPLAPAQGAPW